MESLNSYATQRRAVSSGGGFPIPAHPFREEPGIPRILLYPDCVEDVAVIGMPLSRDFDCRFNDRAISCAAPGRSL